MNQIQWGTKQAFQGHTVGKWQNYRLKPKLPPCPMTPKTEEEVVFAMPSNAVLCGTCELNLDNSTYSKHRTLLLRSPNTSCIIKFAKFLNSFQQEMLTMSHRPVLSSGASNPAKCHQLLCPHKLCSEAIWHGLGLPSCHRIKIKKKIK